MTYISQKSMKKHLSKEWTEIKKQERKHPFRVWFGLAGWFFVAFLAVHYSMGTIASPVSTHHASKPAAHKAQVKQQKAPKAITPAGFHQDYPSQHRR